MPGVQNPHCTPPSSRMLRCSGCISPSAASPSTVVTSRPSAWTARYEHEFTGRPSIRTMHAPHSQSSQPSLVPVRPSSVRSTETSERCGRDGERVADPVDGERDLGHAAACERGADAGGPVGGDGDDLAARAARGDLDRAARDDADGVAPVGLASAQVAERARRLARAGRDRRERLGAGRLPVIACSASGARMIVGATAASAIRHSRDRAVVGEHDVRGGAHDRDLHRPPVLEPHVRAAGAGDGSREVDGDAQLVGARGGLARPGPERLDRHAPRRAGRAQLDLGPEDDERRAGVHRRRAVHHVAAERADVARRGRPDERRAVGERAVALGQQRAGLDVGVATPARRCARRRRRPRRCRPGRARGRWRRAPPGAAPCPGARRRRGRCRRPRGARRRPRRPGPRRGSQPR